MVRHNEHSIQFVQLTDLLHMLQVTLTDIRLGKLQKKKGKKRKTEKKKKENKKRKEENAMTKLMKDLLPPIP